MSNGGWFVVDEKRWFTKEELFHYRFHSPVLSQKYYDPLYLRAEGHPYYVISRQLGIPIGTVRSRIHRGVECILKHRSKHTLHKPEGENRLAP